ncbi:single-stranded DNA-binding protein [Croceicoccus sp. Ery15]|uniref:single-stranded DNA-binding protein n=1 Tax=Croceicoccus sp. Ery15 TaxID=1703338 RepID=UPI001E498ACC|nr:single-stranded DNA-binding protein [Croceicoccus sp. Ery15]
MSLNQCQFIGNLGADPEIRSTQSGTKIANMRIAVTEKYKDRDGNRQEKTEWITIAVFGDGLVGVIERYLRKGSKVFVQGKWRTRKWQDQNGQDRYSTECVLQGPSATLQMLDGAQGGGNQGGGSSGGTGGSSGGYDDLDDDIPF